MTTYVSPLQKLRFVDANGNALVGGKLFTYLAGTTTKQNTYTDSTGATPNANPIILDARGECNCWLSAGVAYKFTLSPSTDTDPPTNAIWTVDNVLGIDDFTGVATLTALAATTPPTGASLIGFKETDTGAAARTVQTKLLDILSVKDFGAVCDGVTDDTTAIQAALDSFGTTAVNQRSGMLYFPGPSLISNTLTARHKSLILFGNGWGSPLDGQSRRSYIIWNGASGIPMLKLQDVQGLVVRDMRFIGKTSSPPSCAIDFNETNDGWPISANTLDNVYIGAMSGESDTGQQFTNGITLDGFGVNNSEHNWRNVKISTVVQDGVHVGSIQNVNINIRGFDTSGCGRAGLYNCGQVTVDGWVSSGNAVDIYVPLTDDNSLTVDGKTTINGYFSELAGRMSEQLGSHQLTINGHGSFSVSASLNADGKVVKIEGATSNCLVLRDLVFGQASSPPAAPFLSIPTGAAGQRHVVIDNVRAFTGTLTGGTNGMNVTATQPGRAYVFFREDPHSTGSGFGTRVAQNYLTGGVKQWNINRFETLNDTAVKLFDDFLGRTLNSNWWGSHVGSDGACVAPALVTGGTNHDGVVQMTTGAGAGATMAVNGVQIESGLCWTNGIGPLVVEWRMNVSSIANLNVFVGLSGNNSVLQAPFTIAGGDVVTANATDAVGFCFDTAATTLNWWLLGVASGVQATKQNSTIAPVANTFAILRISIEGGTATFSINGAVVGTAMANAISSALLTPVITAFSRTAASVNVQADYNLTQSVRDWP